MATVQNGTMDYAEAGEEAAVKTPTRPVRPNKRLLSEDGNSYDNILTDPDIDPQAETFPDEPPEGVHPMMWGMLKLIRKDVAKLNGVENRMAVVEDQLDYDGAEIAKLQQKVQQLVESNKTLAGRLMRAETTIDRQQTTITDLKMRSMRDNIIIKTSGPTYKETREEQTESTVRKFLTDEMRIPNVENICINSSHRMGQANGNFNRMLIARLPRRRDQTAIFDNASNLQGTNYSITKQYPPEVEERRQFAWADYKKARANRQAARFDGGTLVIGGNPVPKYDPIHLPATSDTLLGAAGPAKPRGVSDVMTEQGHTFQAWAIPAHSLADVREGMDQLLQLNELAGATHVPYAFRLGMHENFHSDGDLHAGLSIVRILRDLSANNVAVFVAHHSAGPLPRKKKIDCLANVVSGAIMTLAALLTP